MMRMFLSKEGVYESVSKNPPTGSAYNEAYVAKEQKALQIISLSCDRNQVVYLRQCKTGKEAWDALKSQHQQETVGAQIRIMKQLFSWKLPANGSMRDHLNKLYGLLDKLGEMDAKLSTKVSISVVLASLNDDYDNLVTAIEAWDEDRLTLQ